MVSVKTEKNYPSVIIKYSIISIVLSVSFNAICGENT